MRLSWSNQTDIAVALLAAYPESDRLALSHENILDLILSLPAFEDAARPPQPECLDHILWTWMRLADVDSSDSGGDAQGGATRERDGP